MRGKRTCARRYKLIHDALAERYRPGFSTIDLGASEGYFSIRLSEDLSTQAIMLESKRTIQTIVLAQNNDRLRVVDGKFDHRTLEKLGKFDVAIALSIFHHFANWGQMLQTTFRVSDTVIIELPQAGERSTNRANVADLMMEMLHWYNPTKLGEVPGWGKGSTRALYVLDFPTAPNHDLVFAGRATGGRGSSTRQKRHYLGPATEMTGLAFVPGTFNMALNQDVYLKNGLSFDSAKGPYHLFPCRFEGVPAYVVKPPRAKNRTNSFEIMCSVNLKETFGLNDKSNVRVELDPEYLASGASEIRYRTKSDSSDSPLEESLEEDDTTEYYASGPHQ